MNNIKELVGNWSVNFAFWIDRNYLTDLTWDESEWTFYQRTKWKISNLAYRLGGFLLNED